MNELGILEMVVPEYSLVAPPPPSPGSKWVSKYCCDNLYRRGANRHTFLGGGGGSIPDQQCMYFY